MVVECLILFFFRTLLVYNCLMKKKTADNENRSSLRIANQKKLIPLLMDKAMSLTDISASIGVSFPAASAIVEELEKADILKVVKEQSKTKRNGRIPVLVSFNLDYGLIGVIDVSSQNLKVALYDLSNKIVLKREIPGKEFITKDDFEKLAEILKDMLKSKEAKGRKLLWIGISSPGMINKYTGDYALAYRIKDYDKINPQTYFYNLFGVETRLYNDIKSAAMAEQAYGVIHSGVQNAIFVHLGSSCGLSLLLNGSQYAGSNGYSGEISVYNHIDKESSSCLNNRFYSLHRIYKNTIDFKKEQGRACKNEIGYIDYNLLTTWIQEKDPDLNHFVDESAKMNALALIGYADLLDVDLIVLEGPILLFGESYKNLLIKYINQYDAHEFRPHLQFSSFKDDNSLLGVAYQANKEFFDSVFELLASKRNGN